MRLLFAPVALLALLVTADAATANADWFTHLLEVVAQLGALILYLERRLTRLETKIQPLWDDYTERRPPEQGNLFRPVRD